MTFEEKCRREYLRRYKEAGGLSRAFGVKVPDYSEVRREMVMEILLEESKCHLR